jgi:uncharacterized membrane protein AbrB (regulator of aidB expression)
MNLRDYRFYGLSIADYVATLIAVFLLHSYMWYNANINSKMKLKRTYFQYFFSLFYLFIASLGIATILHYFFGIKSVFSRYLGFNE